MNWNTGQPLAASANSAQMPASSRRQGGLGNRKTSLEQKFTGGFATQHHRGFSDISQQNLMGYKGIGSNLGESGPSGVNLTSKLQGPPQMSEHASMPIMNTSLNGRFMS